MGSHGRTLNGQTNMGASSLPGQCRGDRKTHSLRNQDGDHTNSIYTWGKQFWAETQSLFPDKHEEVILVYTSTNVTLQQQQAIQDTIYMHSAAGGTISDSPSIDMGLLIAETPSNLAALISKQPLRQPLHNC